MKSKIFSKSPAENKVLAAEYVFDFISKSQIAKIVHNVSTGGRETMQVGVEASGYGLIHVTCSSTTDPSEQIFGWGPKDLMQCTNINHVAFVWSDKDSRIIISILTKETIIELAKKNEGHYQKSELVMHAIEKTVVSLAA